MTSMHHRLALALTPYIHHGITTPEEAATRVLETMRGPTEAIRSVSTMSVSYDNDEIWRMMMDAVSKDG